MYTKSDFKDLEKKCRQFRKETLIMLEKAKSGHSGGSLSSIEILTTLYYKIMKQDPKNPKWCDRDYFILSKGHVCPILYVILANLGYFPKEELSTLRKFGSNLQGHPHCLKTKGIEASTGSLGQGLSVANGIALALKLDNKPNQVYCLLGDGEIQEGQIWEAAMSGAHYKLDNVCAIIDYNNLQIDGWVENVMGIADLAAKWRAFNWNVIECDGHNIEELLEAYNKAKQMKGKPSIIIAWTIKGKGVSFMENVAGWHGKPPNKEELEKAIMEIDAV